MSARRNALTPEALAMLDAIGRTGSFAAAARELGKVPSALTYSVRQLEEALDVLLFDRRSRTAQPTAAGEELLREGRRLLQETEAVANRVRRVASGWESELSIVADDILSQTTLFELVEAFCGAAAGEDGGPPTRLRLVGAVLAGTWEALLDGQVDLALGVSGEPPRQAGIELRPLGEVDFVFAVAPHHPLARAAEPVGDDELRPLGEIDFVFAVAPHHPLARAAEPVGDDELVRHRAIAVADTAQRLAPLTLNLLAGQDVLTVPHMRAKLEAQLRGIGCGFLPEPLARPHVEAGRLIVKRTARPGRSGQLHYAWRAERGAASLGRALRWWLERLEHATTRRALVEQHAGLRV